ncbi:MAG: hypothetical protein FWF90_00005, partial [Promicromonosporaceae bacterium]|nr:hypothetical protein [Promicromonosporaceae bacterium]
PRPPGGRSCGGGGRRRGPALAVPAGARIVSLGGSAPPAVPAGRHVVSLAATGPGVGAATLDDGTLLRWGLPASNVPPVVPADRAVFSAVDLVGDVGWTIMAGDPIPVVASVDVDRPVGRPLRVTDGLVVHVNAVMDDGEQAPGSALVTLADPAGQTRVQQWTSVSPDAAPLGFPQVGPLQGQSTPPGPFRLTAEFHGSPFTTTAAATDLDIGGPSPVHVVTSGSSTWRATSPDTLCLQVVSDDGSPLWWGGGFEVSVDEQPTKTIGGGTTGYECLSILGLSPGTYTAHFSYGTYGYVWETPVEADWSGTITVLEPAVSTLAADVPETWAYDARPSSFPFKVTAEELVPRGYVRVATDGQDIGVADVTSGQLPLRSDLLLPGTHQLTFTFDGGFGALPATLERTVVVTPATFTGSRPRISGVPVVGQTLTVDIGSWTPWPATTTFVWRVGGQVWSSTTSSTFVVPPSAAGKLVSVTVTGTSPGYAPLSETTKPFLALPAVPASGPVPRLG